MLAKNHTRRNPDEAFLCGLLHGIGRLYLLTRTPQFPEFLGDPASLVETMRDWHADVAKAILENWEMSEELIGAVTDQDDVSRTHSGSPDLTDVVVVANMMATYIDHPESLILNMSGVTGFKMLGLDENNCPAVLTACREEIEALRQALGG